MKAIRFLLLLKILLAGLAAAEPIGAFTPGARVLFQGDSITDGNRGRSADPNHILGHGYVFIIAAKYGAAFATMNLDFVNRGSSGNTVRELQKRWDKDTLDLKPDVLSILIGVNDESHDVPLDEYERTYDDLITQTKAGNPKLRLVLCEPFTLPVGRRKEGYEAWRAGIQARQDIVAKLAAKHDAALVHFQSVFDAACKVAPAEHWIWDGVHPTYSGHQLMADEWERTVRAKWPSPELARISPIVPAFPDPVRTDDPLGVHDAATDGLRRFTWQCSRAVAELDLGAVELDVDAIK